MDFVGYAMSEEAHGGVLGMSVDSVLRGAIRRDGTEIDVIALARRM